MIYINVPEEHLKEIRLARMQGRLRQKVRTNPSFRNDIHIGEFADLGDAWAEADISVPDALTGRLQGFAIISTNETDVKTICALPGEDFKTGEILYWASNYWMVMARDADDEGYARGTIQRCNYLLKWLDKERRPKYSPCIITDGTKYTAGETFTDMVTMGNTRITLYLPKNEATIAVERDRRFVIGRGVGCMAYKVTRPDAVASVDPGSRVMVLTLSEDSMTANDNHVYGVADYYVDRSAPDISSGEPPKEATDNTGKGVWL